MGREITWSLDKFVQGMHTDPGKVERHEVYANDMENLRFNDRGHLVPRYGHTVEEDVTNTVRGMTVVRRGADVFIFVLDSANRLLHTDLSTITVLATDATLTGRLNSTLVINDVCFITSEGTDRGYWVDLSNAPTTFAAYPLGFTRPDVSSVSLANNAGAGNLDNNADYYYMLSYYRDKAPFYGMQSQVSNILNITSDANGGPIDFSALPTQVEADTGIDKKIIWRTEGKTAPAVTGTATGGSSTTLENTGVNFINLLGISAIGDIVLNTTDGCQGTITDVEETRLFFADGFSGGTDNDFDSGDNYEVLGSLTTLAFYRLAVIDIGDTTYQDNLGDTDLTSSLAFNVAEDADYALPPAGIQSVEWYNNRVYVAGYGSGARFSAIQGGDPLYWAFPTDNEVYSQRGNLHTVKEYRGVLVLAGPENIGRLTGSSPSFDLQLDWTEIEIGPSDAFCSTIAKNLFFYTSTSGVFAFDGIDSRRIDAPLQGIFHNADNQPSTTAAIAYLPTDEIVVDINHVPNSLHSSMVYDANSGGWRKLDDAKATQYITYEDTGVHRVYYALENTQYIRRYWHGFETNLLLAALPSKDETDDVPTEVAISWLWKSQVLAWSALGLEETDKHFKWLEIGLASAATVTVQVWVNGTSISNTNYNVTANPIRPFRIAINRRGVNVQFQISGNVDIEIRRLRLVAMVAQS